MKTTTQIIKDIKKEKKRFWKLYTPLINNNFEAFELMRNIGVKQGELQATKQTAEAVKKEVLEIIDDDIIHPSGNLHKRLYEALKDKAEYKLIEEKEE